MSPPRNVTTSIGKPLWTRPAFAPAWAALSGILLVLSLPKPNLYYLGWVALVPVLVALPDLATRRSAAVTGYAGGLAFFAGSCYWIVATMSTYGGLSVPVSVLVFALFVVVFALHMMVFAVWMRWNFRRFGVAGLMLAAPCWVAVELLQTHLIFGGFPWMLAGYALAPFGGLLQLTTWTGVYGLSFVLVGTNALVALAIRTRTYAPGLAALAVVVSAALIPVPADVAPSDPIDVRIVQTNIDIDQSWLPEDRESLLDDLERLTLGGVAATDVREAEAIDLIVWPETPSPFYLSEDSFFTHRVRAMARAANAHLLAGYIDAIGPMPSNSAGVIAPSGVQVSRYDKMHLVPFGEYVPLGDLLFFAESLVRNVGDFAPGTEYTLTEIDGRPLAATICYEDVFPGLIRRFTARGAGLIVNITNDGWFGETSAPYQHLRMSQVRAAENRRYIVRAANTGISAIIDPYGNIRDRTLIGERTVLDGVAGYRTDRTFYVRFGDVFGWTTAVLALVATVLPLRVLQPGRKDGSADGQQSDNG